MKKPVEKKALAAIIPILLITVAGLVVSSVWAAESEAQETAESSKTKQKPKTPGFYTDSFHLLPELQITAYHDNNIFATERATESDNIAVISPTLKINSRWDRHSLKLNTGANIGRYQDNSSEDYEDLWLLANGNYDLGPATNLFGGAGYNKKHEGRDSKDNAQSVDEPTTYDVRSAHLGVRQRLADYVFRLGATYKKLDFDNVGELFNDDRDRTHSGIGLRASKSLRKRTRVYAQGVLNKRAYDLDLALDGNNRDSEGYTAAIGLSNTFGKKDKIEAFIGFLSQDYDDPGFDTVNEPYFGASLRWNPAESLELTGNLNRILSETTETGASGYLYTSLNLQLDKTLFTNVVGYANYGYGLADYQQVQREDVSNSIGIGVKYFMSPHILLTGSYTYYNNDSNDRSLSLGPGETFDYDKNLFFLTLKAKLAP